MIPSSKLSSSHPTCVGLSSTSLWSSKGDFIYDLYFFFLDLIQNMPYHHWPCHPPFQLFWDHQQINWKWFYLPHCQQLDVELLCLQLRIDPLHILLGVMGKKKDLLEHIISNKLNFLHIEWYYDHHLWRLFLNKNNKIS